LQQANPAAVLPPPTITREEEHNVIKLSNQRACKALLLAGGASIIALATPAAAQQTPDQDAEVGADILDQPQPGDSASAGIEPEGGRIVVTGSRIQRRDYEANSPIVTIDEALLEQSSTAAIEQNLNKLPQFTPAKTPTNGGGDIQPTATNTPGSATVSLRGIGSNRNLVLLDGRRATPGNASGVVDISTIPSAAVERVEIISGGASATYGADAVAGVTNFILKKDFQGLELDAQAGITQEGDGFEYQLSGIMGTDFADGNGNISLAMSVNTRERSFRRDRDWFQDLWNDPNAGGNGGFFLQNPGIEFGFGNPINQAAINGIFPQASTPIPNQNVTFFVNPDGTIFSGDNFASRGGVYRFQSEDDINYKINSAGDIDPVFSPSLLVLPLTRYNALARGNYEINENIGFFGQAMFSRVETFTQQEEGPLTGGWATSVPYGTGVYTGGVLNQYSPNMSSVLLNGVGGYVDPTPGILTDNPTNPAFQRAYGGQYACATAAVGGCTNNQLFASMIPAELQTLLNARANPDAPFTLRGLMPELRATDTNVTTYNLLAGLEGSVPGTDWSWEAFVNHGESDTFANQTGIYSLQRLRTVLTAPGFGQGFSQQGNAAAGGFGASTGTCTTGLNPFGQFEGVSEDCLEATRADLKNRSKVRQTIVEANLTGSLFEMWAGDLQFALGASYRELDFEFLNDTLTTQGRSFQDQALGIYPSGNAEGFIDTHELYGELLIPLLRDTFVDDFSIELGGRMSDYSTTGTSYTYKILGDLAVTDWLRFRGGYNRAERAPNIGELFLAAQQTFGVNNRGDVCSLGNPNSFSANPANANGAAVEAVCRVLMEQSGDPTADEQFYEGTQPTGSFGFAFPTTVGNENLSPEVADTWTAGVVLSSPFSGGALDTLRLTVDYFNIKVKDAIAVQTVGSALQQCFDPALNPLVLTDPVAAANTVFCQNVPRNQTGQLGNVLVTYVNNGRFNVTGIDASLDWALDVGPGTFTLNALVNYLLDFKSADLPTNPMLEYAGTFGTTENGLNEGAFEYRVLGTIGYNVEGYSLALQWQHLPSVDASESALFPDTPITGAPSYNLFNLNATAQLTDAVNIRFGVDNLFNKRPPLTEINTGNTQPTVNGLTPGGSFNDSFYDINGRRFYLGANVRF
jgi:outer membrane receptor protein involved in Fe transport